MPKINILEKDYTSPGTTDYLNFAVVVPGLIAADKKATAAALFDDNGIYECSSKTDFISNIGIVEPSAGTYYDEDAKECAVLSAKFAQIKAAESTLTCYKADGSTVSVTLTAFGTTTLNKTSATGAEKDFIEKARACIYKEVLEKNDVTEAEKKSYINKYYRLEQNPITEEQTLVTYSVYKYTAVGTDTISASNTYAIIDTSENPGKFPNDVTVDYRQGSVGFDGIVQFTHYGNQMAVSLLDLGYPILYKKIENPSDLYANSWDALKDRAAYDFRYLVTGLISAKMSDGLDLMKQANEKIIDVATPPASSDDTHDGRGDCIALCDLNEYNFAAKKSAGQADLLAELNTRANDITANKYAAIFTPSVTYYSLPESFTNKTLPASFHYLACAKLAANNNYAEWYAVAGYSRGVSTYAVEHTSVKLGEQAVSELERRSAPSQAAKSDKAVNIITKIKNGYYLWGNRTANKLGEELVASDFLNIRQLCATLKKQIYITCRRFTFDPNSDTLWINFCNALRPTLDQMKADQGITDYRIIKVENDKKGTLSAKIRIVPIEAVEDFDIEVSLEDSFGETETNITE